MLAYVRFFSASAFAHKPLCTKLLRCKLAVPGVHTCSSQPSALPRLCMAGNGRRAMSFEKNPSMSVNDT
jgi:hypothetical protein